MTLSPILAGISAGVVLYRQPHCRVFMDAISESSGSNHLLRRSLSCGYRDGVLDVLFEGRHSTFSYPLHVDHFLISVIAPSTINRSLSDAGVIDSYICLWV